MNESLLIKLYNDKIPMSQILKRLGISKSYAYQILKKNGIIVHKLSPQTKKRENAIIQDYKNGATIQNILQKYSIQNPASLYSILNKHNIKKRLEKKQNVDVDNIIKLYQNGKSPNEISKIVNRSRGFIRRLLMKNGIQLRENGFLQNSKKEEIINLYNNGHNISEIAKRLSCSRTFIANILKTNNILISKQPARYTSEQKSNIIKLYQENKTMTEISKIIGCSDVTVGAILRKNSVSIRPYVGSNTSQWKGGIVPLQEVIRQSQNYRKWQIGCFARENGKSEISGVDRNLQCHHLYPFKNIFQSSLTKHKSLGIELKRIALINDQRFFDNNNGLIITEEEHKIIEKTSRGCHPCWKIWQSFPEFALKKFDFIEEQYLSFNANGQIDPQNSKLLTTKVSPEIKKIIRYEHYLGTISPHKLILISHINSIITGIGIFGRGANKNTPKDTWELIRLCVPYYVIRPFTIKFLNMCVRYIKKNYPEIDQLIAYADPNVGHDGAVYRMSGWEKMGKTKRSYCYFDPYDNQLKHKSCCRRIKGVNKTEKELAEFRGLTKIPLLPKRKYSLSI